MTLFYWFTRTGRGEQVRLLLAELGLDWEEADTAWHSEAWRALEWEVLWFGAQPALRDGDFTLVQSGVILSYLARKYALAPTDLREAVTADALVWVAEDLRLDLFRAQRSADSLAAFVSRGWPDRWLAAFEYRLTRYGSGFLVGEGLTHADVAWWDALDQAVSLVPELKIPEGTATAAFVQSIASRPRIAAYLASARRPPVSWDVSPATAPPEPVSL